MKDYEYRCPEEEFNSKESMLDGPDTAERYKVLTPEMRRAAEIISEFTGIGFTELAKVIEENGLREIFSNPSLVCSNQEEEKKLMDLKKILLT